MGYHGDGGPAAQAAFYHPEHLAFDSKGDLHVCDNSNDRIRKISRRTGVITTVLGNGQRASNGDGGLAVEAGTLMPDAICLDVHDNLYVGEKYGFRVRKVDAATGVVNTLVGTGVPGFGQEGLHGFRDRVQLLRSGHFCRSRRHRALGGLFRAVETLQRADRNGDDRPGRHRRA